MTMIDAVIVYRLPDSDVLPDLLKNSSVVLAKDYYRIIDEFRNDMLTEMIPKFKIKNALDKVVMQGSEGQVDIHYFKKELCKELNI